MERNEYAKHILDLRRRKRLHTVVEDKLIDILARATPDFHPIREPVGLAGGRNDLMLFEFGGRKVLFEVFASVGQVSRDLRILDKTQADCKVAVLIDKDVDSKVLERFLRENPEDNYPYIFVGELFEDSPIDCILKLRQIILGDEEAKFQRMLRRKLSAPDFVEQCKQEGIDILTEEDIKSGTITFQKVFLAVVAAKLHNLGIDRERLLGLMGWMSGNSVLRFVLMKISVGFNTFLYTDLGGNKGIYSDRELLDWLAISYNFSQPYILLSMNAVIYEIMDDYIVKDIDIDRTIRFTIGRSALYESPGGRVVDFSIPRNVSQIRVFRPMRPMSDEKEEIAIAEYQAIMEFF